MRTAVERKKITPPQLARQWGVSTAKVVGFIRNGELPAVNLAMSRNNRPRYAIDVADVQRFEEARRVVPDGGESTTQKLRRQAAGVKEYF